MYILLTSKKCKFQPQTSIFPANNNPFSIKPTVVWVKIFEKKKISSSSLRSSYNRLPNRKKLNLPLEKYFKTLKDMIIGTESFTIFQSGWNNSVKLWAFDEYSRAFPDKVTPDIYLRDEVVVQWCSRCKNTFLGTSKLQMIINKSWCEYLWVAYVQFLDPVLYMILVSSEIEAYNLRNWLHEGD